MGITIEDIAKQAGVSIATVSRVINGSKFVSGDLREQVLQVIDKYSFKPNSVARSLVTQKTAIIGVILPDIGNDIFGSLIKGLNHVLSARDYTLMVCDSGGNGETERELLATLYDKKAEGVVFAGVHIETDLIREMKDHSLSVVLVSQAPSDGNQELDVILMDNITVVSEGVAYLVANGHRRIAFLAGPAQDYSSGFLRLTGYRKGLVDAGIPEDDGLVKYGDFTYQSGYDCMKELAEEGNTLPTAVFAASDTMAAGAMNFLYDQGISVPGQVSILGLDDAPLASHIRPALTTFRASYFDEGVMAATTLLDIIAGKGTAPRIRFLPHQLIVRESVRSLKPEERQ